MVGPRNERAVSEVVGTVLLFGMVVVAFAVYQGTVVPEQNRNVEIEHNEYAQGEMRNLRDALFRTATTGVEQSVTLSVGADYPPRLLGENLAMSGGSVRTETVNETGPSRVRVRNATAVDDETGDYWNGTARRFATRSIVYQPTYTRYDGAPDTVYENTLLVNQFRDANLTLADQAMVDGQTITLLTVAGRLETAGSGDTATATVETRPRSTTTTSVAVRNPEDLLNVTVRTRLDAATWEEQVTARSDHVESVVQTGDQQVSVLFEPGVTYTLRMASVSVGNGADDPGVAYLTGRERPPLVVDDGTEHRVVVEVRDRFNNPVAGVQVNASVDEGPPSGSFADDDVTTTSDGRAAFTYTAPSLGAGVSKSLTLNLSVRGGDADRTFVTYGLTANGPSTSPVAGGSGAYSISWRNPDATGDNGGKTLRSCSDTGCTWDVATTANTLTLRAGTSPTLDGMATHVAVNDTAVGTVSPTNATTDSAGEVTAELTPKRNGTVAVYVASGGTSDRLNVTLELPGGSGTGLADRDGFVYDDSKANSQNELVYLSADGAAPQRFTRSGGWVPDSRGLGPVSDSLDGDGDRDLPYVDNSNYARLVDADGNTRQFGQTQSGTRMAVGDFDDDGTTELYYATSGNDLAQAAPGEGEQELTSQYPDARAVAGIGDVDGDGADELVFSTNANALKYLDDDGTTVEGTGFGQNLPEGHAIGNPADVDGDGIARIPIVDSSNRIALVNATNGAKTVVNANYGKAAKAPIAATDVDGDAGWEFVFAETNGKVHYMNPDGTYQEVANDQGKTVRAETSNGVV